MSEQQKKEILERIEKALPYASELDIGIFLGKAESKMEETKCQKSA